MISKQRQGILIGGMVVAVVALAADRGWVFQPAESNAGPERASELTPSVDGDSTNLNASSRPRDPRQVADRPDAPDNPLLASMRSVRIARDLFQPTPTMLAKLRHESREGQPTGGRIPLDPKQKAAVFRKRHQLQGTFTGPSGATAVLDGELYQVGDVIEGFELVEIGRMSVRFVRENVSCVLVITVAPTR